MGTRPNTSLVLSAAELDYIQRRFNGSPSAAIHATLGQAARPKQADVTANLYPEAWAIVDGMHPTALERLADAIELRRLEIAADALRPFGFAIRLLVDDGDPASRLRYALVYAPVCGDDPHRVGVFADEEELRLLLDMARNLEPAEAFRRWSQRVILFDETPPSETEMRQATRAARATLQAAYHAGHIDGRALHELWGELRPAL